jgi:hypothetical protein
MNSRDRRVVHLSLRDHAEVTTQSTGEGLRRRVMIVPKHPKAAPAIEQGTPAEHLPKAFVTEPGNQGSVASAPKETPDTIGNQVHDEAPAPTESWDIIGNQVKVEPTKEDDIGNRV